MESEKTFSLRVIGTLLWDSSHVDWKFSFTTLDGLHPDDKCLGREGMPEEDNNYYKSTKNTEQELTPNDKNFTKHSSTIIRLLEHPF